MLAYTVCAEFTDPNVAQEWLLWLRNGHIEEVLAGGAIAAEIIALEDVSHPVQHFEVRYLFHDRAAFARYEKEHAPRLRAEGIALFPPQRGVTYRRTVGLVLDAWPRP